MKRSIVLRLFVTWSMVAFSGCGPKEKILPNQEASVAKAASSYSFLQGSRDLEGLTLEDYAALNGNMASLLERAGFIYCRGYLTPTRGLHGTTFPTLSVESYPEKIPEKSTDEMKAMIDQFFAECEKDLRRLKAPQPRSNQLSEPTSGLAPGRGSS
jgi:hypothetical protein